MALSCRTYHLNKMRRRAEEEQEEAVSLRVQEEAVSLAPRTRIS